jgi:DNA polymerase-3 subunit chi
MVARVEFHTGVEEPLGFACRLLRKACRAGATVLVTAPPERLAALDQALWTFEARAFVPHVRVPGPSAGLAGRTPVWLATEPPAGPRPALLVNLGAEGPDAPDAFERVIEIVGVDDDERRAGRARWRRYESWGIQPKHHATGG